MVHVGKEIFHLILVSLECDQETDVADSGGVESGLEVRPELGQP